MPVTIVHVSDLHFTGGWAENQGVVLNAFIDDLAKQIEGRPNIFAVFTGDILQRGESAATYEVFSTTFLSRLIGIGIPPDRMIFVPGNHDVDRAYTKSQFQVLKGLRLAESGEQIFNDNAQSNFSNILLPKFSKYILWQRKASSLCLCEDTYLGKGFDLSESIGLYVLNTALYSFGGLEDETGNAMDDDRSLPVFTRGLYAWAQGTKHKFKILAMHHPAEWLVSWAKSSVEAISRAEFQLVLSGHVHDADAYHRESAEGEVITCSAPALFTDKSDKGMGYSLIHVDEDSGSTTIDYRHWIGSHFVRGTALSKTDDGSVSFGGNAAGQNSLNVRSAESVVIFGITRQKLERDLEAALKCYSSIPGMWVEPRIGDRPEHVTSDKPIVFVSVGALSTGSRDICLKAPPQFGLSSIGRQMALKQWNQTPGELALFIEATSLPNHEAGISAEIKLAVGSYGLTVEANLRRIVLDNAERASERLLNNLKKEFPSVPLTLLYTVENPADLERPLVGLNFTPEHYFVWTFTRDDFRVLVQAFIRAGNTLDENTAVDHLVRDLENLNLHRTPLNGITLLAVYEKQIDYSPSNRTEMLDRFLHLIFTAYKKNPDYSTIPDLKDSYYVLGNFCQRILEFDQLEFTKRDFLQVANEYCDRQVLEIDCERLFQLMEEESIFIKRLDNYRFRYVQWIFFFAAHRMYHSEPFRSHILSDARYINYPHVIEYYSGIDRRREELVDILTFDLKRLNESFEMRTKIGLDFDPFETARWNPTPAQIGEMKTFIEKELISTNLPSAVKDQIADANYDRSAPYVQDINRFVNDSSLRECLLIMRAAARALRNSDHVHPDKKLAMLNEIVRAWTKLGQMIGILSPFFARDRKITFENLHYYLSPGFDKFDGEKLWVAIMNTLPENTVNYYEGDFSSARLRKLISLYLKDSTNVFGKHIMVSLMIRQRPKGWARTVQDYISDLPKNSYYLADTLRALNAEHQIGFCTSAQKAEIETLMHSCVARHAFGAKKPTAKMLKHAKELLVLKPEEDGGL